MLSLVALGYHGLCLIRWLICWLAGGWVVALGVLLFEKWCFLALCMAYGGNEVTEISRTKKGP
jgi:hypothetical protein